MALETRNQVDAAEVYSRIGRTEGEVAQMNARLDRMESRLERIEAAQTRMMYWIIGLLGATLVNLVSVWVGNLIG